MEELLLGAGKYVAGVLGGMVFMLIIDILVSRDKTGDKEDASLGILRGKEADHFQGMAEENVRRAKEEGRV